MNLHEIRQAGYERGFSIASWQDMPEIGQTLPPHVDWQGIGTIESKYDAIEAWEMLCHEAESNGRQFSPFENVAHAINSRSDSEHAWQVYDDAILRGIRAYRRKHFPLNRKWW